MKRISIFCLLLCISSSLFAQGSDDTTAPKMAAGFGLEWNMNSRDNFAAGAVIGFDYNLPNSFAVGLTVSGSTNFSGIAVIEPAALFRWYFLDDRHSGFFAQIDAGTYLVLEDSEVSVLFLGGLRGGLRLPLGQRFFVEPYGRIGYPFFFGIGALAGMRF